MKPVSYIVDTSVWISFFKGRDVELVVRLKQLIETDRAILVVPVRIELLLGTRSADRFKLERLLAALPSFSPNDNTWSEAERFSLRAKDRGENFQVVDLLIAASAIELAARVWSLDSDFERMAKMRLINC